ncbi:MAG: hypothetical protein JXX29_17005 [Deltaproteobacteria bacterium]|nr:hypothetical protein [Deltaproteobacteria bacterium]MBN2673386.1 hypothetical protein [Deltaproteobacteria bacterium]
MKTITINVSETDYKAFQEYATHHDRTTSELIREAMTQYRAAHMEKGQCILAAPPISVGKVRQTLLKSDDLLEEMLYD